MTRTGDLIGQIKAYHTRFGCYPESVHADKIYRTRGNRKFCKKHGIRLSGPPLGRPSADVEKQKAMAKQACQDELDRIPIEGKFGQGKRRFSLSRIMCKLAITSEASILNLGEVAQGPFFYALFVPHIYYLGSQALD